MMHAMASPNRSEGVEPEPRQPSPRPAAPLSDLPPDPSSGSNRRLIVIVVEPGKEPLIELEGEFAVWELRSILDRALEQVDDLWMDDDEAPGEEDD